MANVTIPPMDEHRLIQLIAVLSRSSLLGDDQAVGFLMVFVGILHEYYKGKDLPA